MARKGLGRGLEALLEEVGATDAQILKVPVTELDTNPNQPRKSFDEEKLRELADSLKRHGMMQPILCKSIGGRYLIIAGERRYRAARLAGLDSVPVLLSEVDENTIAELALVENIQREDLNPLEEAAAIRLLMNQHDLTQEEISERLSKSRPAIANSLRLLTLTAPVTELLRAGKISAGHGKVLAGVESPSRQIITAQRCADEGWSVRRLEDELRLLSLREARPAKKREADPELMQLQRALRDKLDAKVQISGTQNKGKIVISYATADSLQSIYDALFGEQLR